MSLINDALQRAKQAQPGQTPEPGQQLEFRLPVDANAGSSDNRVILAGIVGLSVAALFVLLGMILLRETTQTIRAKTANYPAATSLGAANATADSKPNASNHPNKSSTAAPGNQLGAGDKAAATALLVPRPAPLKLQGIFYSQTRPSAIVGGNTVFVGDRLLGFRVAAIGPNRVVLVSATRTNTLTLGSKAD